MTRRKKSPQQKEQEVVPTARDLLNTDISTMSDLEFRIITLKILAGLEKNMEVMNSSATLGVEITSI